MNVIKFMDNVLLWPTRKGLWNQSQSVSIRVHTLFRHAKGSDVKPSHTEEHEFVFLLTGWLISWRRAMRKVAMGVRVAATFSGGGS